MANTTAAQLRARMAEQMEQPVKCLTCKALDELDPDARQVVEGWFDDEQMPSSNIARAIGLKDSTVRKHRAEHRSE